MEQYKKEIPINNMELRDINPVICGEEQCAPGHSFGPAVRRYYLIHFILSGCGELQIADQTYKIHQNQAFLIRPDEITIYRADTQTPWHYVWVGFNGAMGRLLDRENKIVFDIDPDVISKILLCEKMGDMRELYLTSVLYEILTLLLRGSLKQSPVKSAKNYIDSRYMEPISIENIAQMQNLDRRYLSRVFKQAYGVSMQEYLIQRRVAEAKKLLEESYSVAQTAKMVGYEDAFLFSKLFKKYTGISPKAFALQVRSMS